MNKKPLAIHRNQAGFTIIELMIATAVLSVMLVVASVAMSSIGRLYYKGINQSRVQGAARTIVNNVSENLQISGDFYSLESDEDHPGVGIYCIGDTRYTYAVGKQLGTGKEDNPGETPRTEHVLWRDKTPDGGCSYEDLYSKGTEMVPPKSRLIAFTISPTSPYQINVGVAYGDIDLFNVDQEEPNFDATTRCKGSTGTQFCSVSTLTTVATQRQAE